MTKASTRANPAFGIKLRDFFKRGLTPELSRAAKRHRLGRIVRPHTANAAERDLPTLGTTPALLALPQPSYERESRTPILREMRRLEGAYPKAASCRTRSARPPVCPGAASEGAFSITQ